MAYFYLFFSVRFLCALWSAPSSLSVLAGYQCILIFCLSLVSVLPAHSHFPLPPRAHRVCCAAAAWTHIHHRLSCACWFSRPQSREQSPSVAFFFNRTVHSVQHFSVLWKHGFMLFLHLCLFSSVIFCIYRPSLPRLGRKRFRLAPVPYIAVLRDNDFWILDLDSISVWFQEKGPIFVRVFCFLSTIFNKKKKRL